MGTERAEGVIQRVGNQRVAQPTMDDAPDGSGAPGPRTPWDRAPSRRQLPASISRWPQPAELF